MAEKLITLGKKNTEASKRRALSIFFVSAPLSHPDTWAGLQRGEGTPKG